MRVRITPSRAEGCAVAPPSKSMAHRLLICAALSEGESLVEGISCSEDMSATLDCLSALGASYTREGNAVRVRGFDPRASAPPKAPLLPRESGSTLRFLIPDPWGSVGGANQTRFTTNTRTNAAQTRQFGGRP